MLTGLLVAVDEILPPSPEPLSRQQRRWLVLAFVLVAVTRILAISRSLWDWDELLFCSGLREYDVSRHHPHPPGFPMYIALGHVARLFTSSDFRALQSINVLAAILLLPSIVFLARELGFSFRVSLSGAIVTAFFGNVWFYGGTSFSDIPSLTMILAASALLLRGRRSRACYFWGVLLLALSVGIRSQTLLVGFIPLALGSWSRLRQRFWLDVAAGAVMLITIVGLTYVGAAWATGSWESYQRAIAEHRKYIMNVDSFTSPTRTPLPKLLHDFFLKPFLVLGSSVAVPLFVVVAIAGGFARLRRSVLLLLAMFGPFAVAAWLLLDLSSANRFAVAYTPMFGILAAAGIEDFGALAGRRRDGVAWSCSLLLAVALIVWWAPAIKEVRTTVSPPMQAIEWVRRTVPPGGGRIVGTFAMMPYVSYSLSDYDTQIIETEASLPSRSIEPSEYLVAEGTTIIADAPEFHRPHRRLWQIARHRYFDTYVVPLQKAARFGGGWYDGESDGMLKWRWMGRRSVTYISSLSGPAQLSLSLGFPLASLQRAQRKL